MPKWTDFNLRKIVQSDLPLVLEWRNSERIRKNMYTEHLISWAEHQVWYDRLQESENKISMIFEYKNEPMGLLSFTEIDQYNKTGFWGFYVGNVNAPPGIGTVMGILGIEYAFAQMNIQKISGEAIGFNIGSIKFHTKLGFTEEGRFKKHIFKNEQYHDVIRFALFKEEWSNIHSDIKGKALAIRS